MIHQQTKDWRWLLAPVRWLAYGLIIWRWGPLCRWWVRSRQLDSVLGRALLDDLLAARGTVCRIALATELLINLPLLPALLSGARSLS